MSVKRAILTFGFDKNGEAEFGASADVMSLSGEQMNDLRAMIPVGIGILEDMWRRARVAEEQLSAKEADDD